MRGHDREPLWDHLGQPAAQPPAAADAYQIAEIQPGRLGPDVLDRPVLTRPDV